MLGTWDKIVENMRKEELIKQLQNREPLLAKKQPKHSDFPLW